MGFENQEGLGLNTHLTTQYLPVSPWASCFTCVSLCFFICKMGLLGLSDNVQKYLAADLVHNIGLWEKP